jgi:hypothetical protein
VGTSIDASIHAWVWWFEPDGCAQAIQSDTVRVLRGGPWATFLVLSRGLLRCEPFGDLTRIQVNGLKIEVNECNVIDGHSLGEAPYEHRARFDPASSVRLIRVSGWGIAPSLPQRDVTVKGEWLLTLRAPKALHARRLAQPPKTRWTDHTSRRGLSQSRARVLPGE